MNKDLIIFEALKVEAQKYYDNVVKPLILENSSLDNVSKITLSEIMNGKCSGVNIRIPEGDKITIQVDTFCMNIPQGFTFEALEKFRKLAKVKESISYEIRECSFELITANCREYDRTGNKVLTKKRELIKLNDNFGARINYAGYNNVQIYIIGNKFAYYAGAAYDIEQATNMANLLPMDKAEANYLARIERIDYINALDCEIIADLFPHLLELAKASTHECMQQREIEKTRKEIARKQEQAEKETARHQWEQEQIKQGIADLLDKKQISGVMFCMLCEHFKIELHPRTISQISRYLSTIGNDGINFQYSKGKNRPKFDKVFDAYYKLMDALPEPMELSPETEAELEIDSNVAEWLDGKNVSLIESEADNSHTWGAENCYNPTEIETTTDNEIQTNETDKTMENLSTKEAILNSNLPETVKEMLIENLPVIEQLESEKQAEKRRNELQARHAEILAQKEALEAELLALSKELGMDATPEIESPKKKRTRRTRAQMAEARANATKESIEVKNTMESETSIENEDRIINVTSNKNERIIEILKNQAFGGSYLPAKYVSAPASGF